MNLSNPKHANWHPLWSAAVLCAVWVIAVRAEPPQQTAAPSARPARPPDIFFVPTEEPVVYQMLELAQLTRDDIVYDLGSGDGRIVVLAAQKYGARGVGIELDPTLVRAARQVVEEVDLDDKVTFLEGDLFTANITPATVVTLYLSPGVNRDLELKLRRELRPGTRVVSHQFGIGRWQPSRKVRASDGTDLFLWVIGKD